MAVAAVEERQLLKALRWYDGFVIALANPGFLLGSLGYSVGDLGGWGAMLLWGISACVAILANYIYAETAAMFPQKPGGIALYAHEGWRRYFSLVGPVATFGYWIGWSVVLAVFGIFIGQIIQGRWFPGQPAGTPLSDEGWFNTGYVNFGLPHLIAVLLIVGVWLFNILGIKVSLTFGYLAGILLMIPLFCMIVLPYITGDWTSANMTYNLNDPGLDWGGWKLAIVWLWIMGWSAYGVEVCATFAPEYKNTQRDTALALRSAALFSLAVYIFLPMGFVGGGGPDAVAGYDYAGAIGKIVGGGFAEDFLLVLIMLSFLISMNTATADGGRALYGIARDDMTIKELYHLNRFHVPARAMTIDMVINILFVLFVGNIFGILAASNLGYVSCHVFALTGFLLLRKDRPNWPRPIKLSPIWLPVAGVLAAFNFILVALGPANMYVAAGGYGGKKELWIGVGVLFLSIALFLFRRIVQDKAPLRLRETTPTMPGEVMETREGLVAAASH